MGSAHVQNFTDANFEADVPQSPVPVLVDFWAGVVHAPPHAHADHPSCSGAVRRKAKIGKVDTDANRQISVK